MVYLTFRSNAGLGFRNSVNSLVIKEGGIILVGGEFSTYAVNAASPGGVFRFNADGTEDLLFSSNAGSGFGGETVNAIAVQEDGKILLGGNFSWYAGLLEAPDNIIRLNSDGTEDLTFRLNAGQGFDNAVSAIAFQPDGKILVGGAFASYAGSSDTPDLIVRLNSDGSEDLAFRVQVGTGLDSGFGFGGPARVWSVSLQDDGKIIVGGMFAAFNNDFDAPENIIRLNANGSEDLDFRTTVNGGFYPDFSSGSYVKSTAVDANGKIIIGGTFTEFAGDADAPDSIIRLNADGSEDLSFRAGVGSGLDSSPVAIAAESSSKILLGGYFNSLNGDSGIPSQVIRLNSDGTEDLTFKALVGTGFNNLVNSVTVKDGKALIGGEFSFLGNLYRSFFTEISLE